jgi:hypothetical protein
MSFSRGCLESTETLGRPTPEKICVVGRRKSDKTVPTERLDNLPGLMLCYYPFG